MQKFRTLAAFFLVEKQQPRREREKKKKNAKYYGHFGAGARTPLGPKPKASTPNADQPFTHRQLDTITVSCSLTITRSGFLYRAAKIWNSLPAAISCVAELILLLARILQNEKIYQSQPTQ